MGAKKRRARGRRVAEARARESDGDEQPATSESTGHRYSLAEAERLRELARERFGIPGPGERSGIASFDGWEAFRHQRAALTKNGSTIPEQIADVLMQPDSSTSLEETLRLFESEGPFRRDDIDTNLLLSIAAREGGASRLFTRREDTVVSAGRDTHREGRSGLDNLFDAHAQFPAIVRGEVERVTDGYQPGRENRHAARLPERYLLTGVAVWIERMERRFEQLVYQLAGARADALLDGLTSDSRRAWVALSFAGSGYVQQALRHLLGQQASTESNLLNDLLVDQSLIDASRSGSASLSFHVQGAVVTSARAWMLDQMLVEDPSGLQDPQPAVTSSEVEMEPSGRVATSVANGSTPGALPPYGVEGDRNDQIEVAPDDSNEEPLAGGATAQNVENAPRLGDGDSKDGVEGGRSGEIELAPDENSPDAKAEEEQTGSIDDDLAPNTAADERSTDGLERDGDHEDTSQLSGGKTDESNDDSEQHSNHGSDHQSVEDIAGEAIDDSNQGEAEADDFCDASRGGATQDIDGVRPVHGFAHLEVPHPISELVTTAARNFMNGGDSPTENAVRTIVTGPLFGSALGIIFLGELTAALARAEASLALEPLNALGAVQTVAERILREHTGAGNVADAPNSSSSPPSDAHGLHAHLEVPHPISELVATAARNFMNGGDSRAENAVRTIVTGPLFGSALGLTFLGELTAALARAEASVALAPINVLTAVQSVAERILREAKGQAFEGDYNDGEHVRSGGLDPRAPQDEVARRVSDHEALSVGGIEALSHVDNDGHHSIDGSEQHPADDSDDDIDVVDTAIDDIDETPDVDDAEDATTDDIDETSDVDDAEDATIDDIDETPDDDNPDPNIAGGDDTPIDSVDQFSTHFDPIGAVGNSIDDNENSIDRVDEHSSDDNDRSVDGFDQNTTDAGEHSVSATTEVEESPPVPVREDPAPSEEPPPDDYDG